MVDFPQPVGPTTAQNWPGSTTRSTSSRAVKGSPLGGEKPFGHAGDLDPGRLRHRGASRVSAPCRGWPALAELPPSSCSSAPEPSDRPCRPVSASKVVVTKRTQQAYERNPRSPRFRGFCAFCARSRGVTARTDDECGTQATAIQPDRLASWLILIASTLVGFALVTVSERRELEQQYSRRGPRDRATFAVSRRSAMHGHTRPGATAAIQSAASTIRRSTGAATSLSSTCNGISALPPPALADRPTRQGADRDARRAGPPRHRHGSPAFRRTEGAAVRAWRQR